MKKLALGVTALVTFIALTCPELIRASLAFAYVALTPLASLDRLHAEFFIEVLDQSYGHVGSCSDLETLRDVADVCPSVLQIFTL